MQQKMNDRWMWLKKITLLASVMVVSISGLAQSSGSAAPQDTIPVFVEPWESAMLAFEALDRSETYPSDAIFFTGSSSIVLWRTMARDMAPFPVIQRGFGGSNMTDVLRLYDRYVPHHDFSAMVVFVANDIRGMPDDKTPEQVRDLFEAFIGKVRAHQPEAPIFLIAITPTRSRWRVWDEIRRVNGYLAELADHHEQVLYIPTEDLYLGQDGLPLEHLFVSDQLHLSEAGYELWSRRLRAYIVPVMSR